LSYRIHRAKWEISIITIRDDHGQREVFLFRTGFPFSYYIGAYSTPEPCDRDEVLETTGQNILDTVWSTPLCSGPGPDVFFFFNIVSISKSEPTAYDSAIYVASTCQVSGNYFFFFVLCFCIPVSIDYREAKPPCLKNLQADHRTK